MTNMLFTDTVITNASMVTIEEHHMVTTTETEIIGAIEIEIETEIVEALTNEGMAYLYKLQKIYSILILITVFQ